jgi:DNA-binding NarL/FixJ family response regulator
MNRTIRVMCAEDHPVYREGLRHILAQDPEIRLVHETGQGAEALEQARRLKPDVVLLDIHLPGPDGLQIARIRQRERLPFEIVFLTMHKEEAMVQEAVDLGVKGYVLKESAATDILKAIHAVAEGRSYISPELSDFLLRRRAAAEALRAKQPGLDDLTAAERRVLRLIASDRTTKEIADELDLSPRTVDCHRSNICSKLGLKGSHSLLKFAFENRSKLG